MCPSTSLFVVLVVIVELASGKRPRTGIVFGLIDLEVGARCLSTENGG